MSDENMNEKVEGTENEVPATTDAPADAPKEEGETEATEKTDEASA